MSKILARRGRWSAYKLVLMQAAVAGGASVLFFVLWGMQYGMSALAGMIIAVFPNFVFATLAFSHMGASQSGKVIQTFYWGEAIKLLLTIALFCIVFAGFKVDFAPLFTTYTLALAVHWTAPFLFNKKTG
ncbi:ATP synthase subunit I [Shewanella sp. GXUN23E]|uniref:ATP synthase subunit I n=1 Tax=Shewanella sp. GXUN23E TaxID=3422498 RepID=UPI003D7DA091